VQSQGRKGNGKEKRKKEREREIRMAWMPLEKEEQWHS